jgi:hypothetical protein
MSAGDGRTAGSALGDVGYARETLELKRGVRALVRRVDRLLGP